MINDAKRKAIRLFAKGRELYKKREFVAALKYFDAAYKADPTDTPSDIFVARCKQYIKDPPAEGWDGVNQMETK